MVSEEQIAKDMASAYQGQSAFEYMLANEMRDRKQIEAAIYCQTKAKHYSNQSRLYLQRIVP